MFVSQSECVCTLEALSISLYKGFLLVIISFCLKSILKHVFTCVTQDDFHCVKTVSQGPRLPNNQI